MKDKLAQIWKNKVRKGSFLWRLRKWYYQCTFKQRRQLTSEPAREETSRHERPGVEIKKP